TVSPEARSTSATITDAPSCANRSTAAAPIPVPPPVTSTTLSASTPMASVDHKARRDSTGPPRIRPARDGRGRPYRRGVKKDRLEAFSDGVIAIIITIMVLELRILHGTDAAVLRPLVLIFLTYVLSFVNIGIYW